MREDTFKQIQRLREMIISQEERIKELEEKLEDFRRRTHGETSKLWVHKPIGKK